MLFRSVLDRFGRVLYLCVGSAYTGNYDAVMGWKRENDPEGRLTVIDSATASGRLGIVAIATALFSRGKNSPEAVASFARRAIKEAREYVFLDRLRYLAAGGRLSRTGTILGEALRLKPVICPEGEGAKMVGKARTRTDQLEFALKRLAENLPRDSNPFIMLEYSDNGPWVKKVPMEEIGNRYPNALIRLQPLSLTSGAHMGPGTWAIAYLPESFMPASFPEWSYP